MEGFVQSEEIRTSAVARARPRAAVPARRNFLIALLAATWVPIAFFIVLAPTQGTTTGVAGIKTIFLFLGTAHVPATFYFYTDRHFSEIIRDHRARYIYIPLLLTIATGLLFATLSQTGQAFLLFFYWAWQAFHYGRQNVGIYAFASIAESGTAPNRLERLAIDAATVLGILGTFKVMGLPIAPAFLKGFFTGLYQAGAIGFAVLLVLSLFVYIKLFRTTTLFKTLFFFTSVLFFAPVYLSTDVNVGFLSYAMAHGLQYLIFMWIVSTTNEEKSANLFAYRQMAVLGVLVLVFGFLFWRVGDLRQMQFILSNKTYAFIADFLFGAVLGATMSHFVIDASAWKLRLQPQRAYMSKKFSFVFQPAKPLPAPIEPQ